MPGVALLREAIAVKIQTLYDHAYDSETEITITSGATEALMTAVLAIVNISDEVVVIEPCYDSCLPAIRLADGTAVPVPLRIPATDDPYYRIDWQRVPPVGRSGYCCAPRQISAELRKVHQFMVFTVPSPIQFARGTFFLLAHYRDISKHGEDNFARELTVRHGVTVIPVSAFYQKPEAPESNHHMIRFCFAKEDATLDAALERLAQV